MTNQEMKDWEKRFDEIYPKIILANLELRVIKDKLERIGGKLDMIEAEVKKVKEDNEWEELVKQEGSLL